MNNIITEDYCSPEVSKLLKEKGCDVSAPYWDFEEIGILSVRKLTHALAIKWIRENFNIHIIIGFQLEPKVDYFEDSRDKEFFEYIYWIMDLNKMREKGITCLPYIGDGMDGFFNKTSDKDKDGFLTWGEATEAALLHTLTKLI